MLTIGFTSQYYTLWQVGEMYKEYVTEHSFYWKRDCQYIKNLSKDLETAKAKLDGQEFNIDLELRGTGSFTWSSELKSTFEPYQFTFGKLQGEDIRTCTDVWQLNRIYGIKSENGRRRVYARRRLIELGELVRFNWVEEERINVNWGKRDENGHVLPENYQPVEYKRKYATAEQVRHFEFLKAKEEKNKNHGHYFNNGEKVELEVIRVETFHYDTQYGTIFIVVYMDSQGRYFKYKGSTPPYWEESKAKYLIRGTVEHGEYNGQKETRLKRIKVLQQV